jgi:hydrogenase small subunit
MSPFYKPLPTVPGFGVDVTAEKIGWGVVGAAAGLTAAHGLVSIARNRRKKSGDGQPEEKQPEQKEPVETES